jgi:hypothetical protein
MLSMAIDILEPTQAFCHTPIFGRRLVFFYKRRSL